MNHAATIKTPVSPPGRVLREWRAVRGMSQLDLAGVSRNHIEASEFCRNWQGKAHA